MRSKSYEGGTSKGRIEIQDKPRFKKRVFATYFLQIYLRQKTIGFFTLSPKRKKSGNSPSDKPTSAKYG